jgi:hypothetical protein
MITLSVILILVFVPASRKAFLRMGCGLCALLGLAFLITSASERRK